MRIMRGATLGAALAAAAALAGTAFGVGPWPGLAQAVRAPAENVRYTARTTAGTTAIEAIVGGRVVRTLTLNGAWGIPAVTSTGLAGGLSPDGRLLVLGQPPTYEGLRDHSRFVVLSTRTLAVSARVVLPGEFGFDAISPDRGTLYLIQHISTSDLVRYVVRGYDLRAHRLLRGVIADKRLAGEQMRGYPIARATSGRGAWVYTLYARGTGVERPFVHALYAAGRTAFCIDLPSWKRGTNIWNARLRLAGTELLVRAGGATVARIDTRTLGVR